MTQAEIDAIEQRLGVRFPEAWREWSPATQRDYVSGVVDLTSPEGYETGETGEVVIGTSSDGFALALIPKRRGSNELKDGVYELRDGRPRLVVPTFADLLVRVSPRRGRDDKSWEQRMAWAQYACGQLRVCADCARAAPPSTCRCGREITVDDPPAVRTLEQITRARGDMPDLFAAIDFVERYARLREPDEILRLETARARRQSAETVIASWERRGFELADIPLDDLRGFLDHAGA